MFRHLITLPLLLAVFAAAPVLAADAKTGPRIKKCQDAQGRWHYGDTADDECARSKVIELDTRGIKRKEIAAPLTQEELKARASQQAEAEQNKKLAAEQQRRDEILLATYALEADITMTRDRKIAEMETQIRSTEETLTSLRNSLTRLQTRAAEEQRGGKDITPQTAKTLRNNEAQIDKHEAAIRKMRQEQEAMRVQYQADLERFRDLKNRQALQPPPAPASPAKP